MAIIPSQNSLQPEMSSLSLAEYAQHIGYNESLFWGVRPFEYESDGSCNDIWQEHERRLVARYLWEAEQEIMRVTRFPLGPRWIKNEITKPYTVRTTTKKHKVIAGGVRGEVVIEAGSAVIYIDNDETGVIEIVDYDPLPSTEPFDVEQIFVYHPGTNAYVTPSQVTYEEGVLSIHIPRYRLVRAEYAHNPKEGYPIEDDEYFATEMDVRRVYNDTSKQAEVLCQKCRTCDLDVHDACIAVLNGEVGAISLSPARDNCVWNCAPVGVRLNYLAGEPMDAEKRETLIMLAHVKMPADPCSCSGAWQSQWKAWREVPPVLDSDRLKCPFGIANGAWVAWTWANRMAVKRFAPMTAGTGFRG